MLASVSSFAALKSQDETKLIEAKPKSSLSANKELIKNLLSGMDFKVEDALIASANTDGPNTTYNITLRLVVADSSGKTTEIDLFESDSFNTDEGYVVIGKEFHVNGSTMFKTLDPHINIIERATSLDLAVSLNKSLPLALADSSLKKTTAQTHSTIYSTSVSFNNSKSSFNQEIDLPESFSYEENSNINDLGFGLFFR